MERFVNSEAEAELLSTMMVNPADMVAGMLIIPHSKIFGVEAHRIVYESMKRQYDANTPIDLVTTAKDLKNANLYQKIGGPTGLAKILGQPVKLGYVEVHVQIIMDEYFKREILTMVQKMQSRINDDDCNPLEEMGELIRLSENVLLNTVDGEEQELTDVLRDLQQQWLEPNYTGLSGLSSGLRDLDRISMGATPGNLIVLGARPGQGKTAFVISMVRNLCNRGVSCGIISLEMSRHELTQRLLSQESQISAAKISTRNINHYETIILNEAKARMEKWNLKIHDRGDMNVRKLRSKVTLWKRRNKIEILFIDYLQLMSGSEKKNASRENEIAEISRCCKMLAKELEIPVIALSQLSRKVEERNDKMPQLSDLRESGAIEQDADIVWFLVRPDYYKMKGEVEIGGRSYNLADVCILDQAKMRGGSTGQIALKFVGPLMQMKDYD